MKQTTPHPSSIRLTAQGGFSMIEVLVATAVCLVMATGLIGALAFNERYASTMRLYTCARAIVQRNLDAATGVLFTGTTSTPAILGITSTSGSVCDDDGGSNSVENIQVSRSGSTALVSGTLTRIVVNEPVYVTSSTTAYSGTMLLRVTFQVSYTYMSRNYTYSETTLRSADTP